ncbi:YceI family protein [Flavobacterium jejuense]|uniref:YceI family protein n=1 Tax=Flavobacterium jejuense TaxID=1544455 RepID=A0ABX0IMP6_9FLAO|nr:YceI family protein [Flavobacterium jejuense]NHN25072.1 YceI family protein [Flavobacterium jejuense]
MKSQIHEHKKNYVNIVSKKIALFAFAMTILTTSCKKEEKTETPVEEIKTEEVSGLKIVSDSTKVSWTAYKTTDKVAVGGSFKEIELKNTQTGNTPEAVLEGASFSIPVSSLFTNNEDRDNKLKTIFFAALKNTEMIGGALNFRDGKCFLTLTLNDVTKQMEVPFTYENKKFALNSTINLDDFGGQTAIEAINKACFELHKGADGVSKTWSDVAISGSVLFE